MEKLRRRVLGFENPDLVPVDQDQWERLKDEIQSVQPLTDSHANAKWGIWGFCSSLALSNIFYLLSEAPNSNVPIVSTALIIGLLISAWTFGKLANKDKEAQDDKINQYQRTIQVIENRLRTEEPELMSALIADSLPSKSLGKDQESLSTPISPESPSETLNKLASTSKIRI